MNYLGIDYSVKNMPALDPGFIPFGIWAKAYLQEADRPFRIAVERDHGKITVYETRLRGEAFAAANIRFAERLVKMLLWSAGGFRIYLQGDDTIAVQIRDAYRPGGAREFDAGGSDRKVSAVIDGKTVYSEEVVWHPKTSADPQYQFDGIVTAFQTAASKMPRVDGIGVSSAGTFVGNAPMVSSLFIKIGRAHV